MLKEYPDTKQGAKDLINEMYDKSFFDPDIFDPDPHAQNVWLAIDTKKKMAMVIYLHGS